LLECVPNFSEGLDQAVIDAIAHAAAEVASVRLLNVDSGRAANRTVITFAGPKEAVIEAAFRAIAAACRFIDMRRHIGVHPRMGAADVCPFAPLAGAAMADAVEAARVLGARVGSELNTPVYLYGHAASKPDRRELSALRKGEYEALPLKLADPAWPPDFGPVRFNPRTGATAIGARPLMIAYNVNLTGSSLGTARRIAGEIRESGRRGKPGLFRGLRAIGWRIEDFDRIQISMNIHDPLAAPLFDVYRAVDRLARAHGAAADGSEAVGLIPYRALAEAGMRFRPGAEGDEALEAAVEGLGLCSVKAFSTPTHVLERALGIAPLSLAQAD